MRVAASRPTGIALIEAMIAMVVLSFGLFSVAKFHGDLIGASAYTKARSEAMALGESKMEELRNLATQGQFDALPATNTWTEDPDNPIAGTNASFTRRWRSPGTGSDWKGLEVEVLWDDPKEGAGQSVTINSVIAWDDPALGLLASGNGETGGGSGLVNTPRGAAHMGGQTPDNPPDLPPGSAPVEYVTGSGERLLLGRNSSGDTVVLMTVPDGEEFSTIEGTIYIDNTVNPAISPSAIQLHSSDAVYCHYDRNALSSLPASGTTKLRYFTYKCWVGARWYGNIGVVYTGNNAPRACVGDPTITTYQDVSTRRQPWPSTNRAYRGYQNIGLPSSVSTGIGINPSTASYTEQEYVEQNFLLTRFNINVNATNQQILDGCRTRMMILNTTDATVSPMARQNNDGFGTHTGRFVCLSDLMTEPNPSSCPASLPTGSPPTTTITLTIERGSSNRGTVTGLTLTDGDCTSPSGTNNSMTSTCTINWRGSTIAAGTIIDAVLGITLEPGHVLCSTTGSGQYSGQSDGIETITFGVGPTVTTLQQTIVVRSSLGSC